MPIRYTFSGSLSVPIKDDQLIGTYSSILDKKFASIDFKSFNFSDILSQGKVIGIELYVKKIDIYPGSTSILLKSPSGKGVILYGYRDFYKTGEDGSPIPAWKEQNHLVTDGGFRIITNAGLVDSNGTLIKISFIPSAATISPRDYNPAPNDRFELKIEAEQKSLTSVGLPSSPMSGNLSYLYNDQPIGNWVIYMYDHGYEKTPIESINLGNGGQSYNIYGKQSLDFDLHIITDGEQTTGIIGVLPCDSDFNTIGYRNKISNCMYSNLEKCIGFPIQCPQWRVGLEIDYERSPYSFFHGPSEGKFYPVEWEATEQKKALKDFGCLCPHFINEEDKTNYPGKLIFDPENPDQTFDYFFTSEKIINEGGLSTNDIIDNYIGQGNCPDPNVDRLSNYVYRLRLTLCCNGSGDDPTEVDIFKKKSFLVGVKWERLMHPNGNPIVCRPLECRLVLYWDGEGDPPDNYYRLNFNAEGLDKQTLLPDIHASGGTFVSKGTAFFLQIKYENYHDWGNCIVPNVKSMLIQIWAKPQPLGCNPCDIGSKLTCLTATVLPQKQEPHINMDVINYRSNSFAPIHGHLGTEVESLESSPNCLVVESMTLTDYSSEIIDTAKNLSNASSFGPWIFKSSKFRDREAGDSFETIIQKEKAKQIWKRFAHVLSEIDFEGNNTLSSKIDKNNKVTQRIQYGIIYKGDNGEDTNQMPADFLPRSLMTNGVSTDSYSNILYMKDNPLDIKRKSYPRKFEVVIKSVEGIIDGEPRNEIVVAARLIRTLSIEEQSLSGVFGSWKEMGSWGVIDYRPPNPAYGGPTSTNQKGPLFVYDLTDFEGKDYWFYNPPTLPFIPLVRMKDDPRAYITQSKWAIGKLIGSHRDPFTLTYYFNGPAIEDQYNDPVFITLQGTKYA